MTSERENEKTVEEIAADKPGLFTSRLVGKAVELMGVTFHIRRLPALVVTYIRGQAGGFDGRQQLGIITALYVRFGIEDIVGLTDENGKVVPVLKVDINPVRIDHKSEKLMGVPEDVLTRIHPDIYDVLFNYIASLTHLGEDGERKLDFTTASENPGPETNGKDVQ